MPESLPNNTTVSHYRIVSHLGTGGMGEVYLATDNQLERNIALKVLPAEFCCDAERVRRFKQEAAPHPRLIIRISLQFTKSAK